MQKTTKRDRRRGYLRCPDCGAAIPTGKTDCPKCGNEKEVTNV
jgi:uncharacterized OB-fold protein